MADPNRYDENRGTKVAPTNSRSFVERTMAKLMGRSVASLRKELREFGSVSAGRVSAAETAARFEALRPSERKLISTAVSGFQGGGLTTPQRVGSSGGGAGAPGADGADAMLPAGSAGDLFVHDGSDWTTLANPGSPGGDPDWVLRHDGTAPYWAQVEEC